MFGALLVFGGPPPGFINRIWYAGIRVASCLLGEKVGSLVVGIRHSLIIVRFLGVARSGAISRTVKFISYSLVIGTYFALDTLG
jgi:hypothetical protein